MYCYLSWYKVCRQTLSQAYHRGLGGSIGKSVGSSLDRGGHRAHVDDGSTVRNLVNETLHHPEHAANIDVKTTLENVVGALEDAALVNISENEIWLS